MPHSAAASTDSAPGTPAWIWRLQRAIAQVDIIAEQTAIVAQLSLNCHLSEPATVCGPTRHAA